MKLVNLGAVFVLVMVAVSAAFNFTFGWRLGVQSYTVSPLIHDGWIYGALSVASDGFKISLGVLLVMILMSRNLHWLLKAVGAPICAILFTAGTLYSLNSAIGTISQNRTDMAGVRQAKATNYDSTARQLAQVESEQSWLDQKYRAAAAVTADMARMRQDFLWSRTSGCSDATVPESRAFCQNYYALQAELGTSERAERLAKRADTLRADLAAIGGKVIADPHAQMLNLLTGYGEETIVLAWLLLVVALVEGGSTLGPIVIWLARRAEQPTKLTEAPEQPITVAKPVDTRPDLSHRPVASAQQEHWKYNIPGDENRTLLNTASWEAFQRAISTPPKAHPKMEELLAKPTPWDETPDPEGGTPKTVTPEPVETEQSTVVAFPVTEPPKSKKQKKEELRAERDNLLATIIAQFVDERLNTDCEAARLVTTGKGFWREGGMEGRKIHAEFKRYCEENGYDSTGAQQFGKHIRAHVDAARCGNRMHYGAVIRTQQKRKMVA